MGYYLPRLPSALWLTIGIVVISLLYLYTPQGSATVNIIALNMPAPFGPASISTSIPCNSNPSIQTGSSGSLLLLSFTALPSIGSINSQTTFTATTTGGQAPYQYNWTINQNYVSGSFQVATGLGNPFSFTFRTSSNYFVIVTATDSANNKATAVMGYMVNTTACGIVSTSATGSGIIISDLFLGIILGVALKLVDAPLGSGRRFRRLEGQLANRRGVQNPAGLAAYIGRKKYGNQGFQRLSRRRR